MNLSKYVRADEERPFARPDGVTVCAGSSRGRKRASPADSRTEVPRTQQVLTEDTWASEARAPDSGTVSSAALVAEG